MASSTETVNVKVEIDTPGLDKLVNKAQKIIDGINIEIDEFISELSKINTVISTLEYLKKSFNACEETTISYMETFKILNASFVDANQNSIQLSAGMFQLDEKLKTTSNETYIWDDKLKQLISKLSSFPGSFNAIAIGLSVIGAALIACDTLVETSAMQHRKKIEVLREEESQYESFKQQQLEYGVAQLKEIEYAQILKSKLDDLVDSNGKVLEGQENNVKFILTELNKATGMNLELVDNEISGYSKLSEDIELMLQKKRAEILLEAQLPAYKEAVLKVNEAELESRKLSMEASEAEIELLNMESFLRKQYGEDFLNNSELKRSALYQEYIDLQNNTAFKTAEYEAQKQIVDGYYKDIQLYEENAKLFYSENEKDILQIEQNILGAKVSTSEQKKEILENELDVEKRHLETLKEQYEDFGDETYLQMIEDQNKKVSVIENELKDMENTVETDGKDVVKAYSNMTSDAVDAVKKESGSPTGRDGEAGFYGAGKQSGDGYRNGLNSTISSIAESSRNLVRNAIKAAKKEQESASPSKLWEKEIGKMAGAGYAMGLDNSHDLVNESAESLISDAFNHADNMQNSFTNSYTSDLVNRMAEGIALHQQQFQAIARTVGSKTKMQFESMENTISKALINGKMEAHLYIEGREAAIALAPFISEELAFEG